MIEFDPVLVHNWLSRSARRWPNKEALVCGQQRVTYAELDERTTHLAHGLRKMGVVRGDRVAILLDNCTEAVTALYGILKAGAAFVMLSATMKGSKLRYILDNCGAEVLITHTSKAKVVADALNGRKKKCNILWVGIKQRIPESLSPRSACWQDVFATSGDDLPRCIDIDLATLIYTSGSTGEPKGVMSTHHNILSAGRSIIQYIGNVEDDIILNVLPLSFDYGLYQVIMAFMFGGTVVLERSFVYLHKVLQRISEEKVTGFPIVPTILAMLLRLEDASSYDFSSLRYITNTGAALPVEHVRRLRELLPEVKIFSMFGLTECKRVCYLPPEDLDGRLSSVGKAMPNCEVFVVDENGRQVQAGETGELIIRGSNVMQGYWGDGRLTARTYRDGQYPAGRTLYSGDYFRQDEDGYLYFLGRKDDMIKCKGERVSAKEVEDVICGIEGVAEAAVIGVPDEILGQAIKVFIVPAPGAGLTENDVLKHSTQAMETFMVPKYVQFVESLPKTANGKIDKKQLKEAAE